MEKGEEFGECKWVNSRVQEENKCGSKEIRKVIFGRKKRTLGGRSCQRNICQKYCINEIIESSRTNI